MPLSWSDSVKLSPANSTRTPRRQPLSSRASLPPNVPESPSPWASPPWTGAWPLRTSPPQSPRARLPVAFSLVKTMALDAVGFVLAPEQSAPWWSAMIREPRETTSSEARSPVVMSAPETPTRVVPGWIVSVAGVPPQSPGSSAPPVCPQSSPTKTMPSRYQSVPASSVMSLVIVPRSVSAGRPLAGRESLPSVAQTVQPEYQASPTEVPGSTAPG